MQAAAAAESVRAGQEPTVRLRRYLTAAAAAPESCCFGLVVVAGQPVGLSAAAAATTSKPVGRKTERILFAFFW
jgi:hypothetical protein